MRKNYYKRNILLGIMSLFLFSLTACGYTKEEQQAMKEYEKQGKSMH